MRNDFLFQSKQKRDEFFKTHGGKRYSVRNQQLHPQYVEDADPALKSQTGFGNTVYRTFFKVLYGVKDFDNRKNESSHTKHESTCVCQGCSY